MLYIYVKKWVIVASWKDWNLTIWKKFEVEKEWFYKLKDWVPYLVEDEIDAKWAFLVKDRKRDEFERRRKEAIWEDQEKIANEENVDNVNKE